MFSNINEFTFICLLNEIIGSHLKSLLHRLQYSVLRDPGNPVVKTPHFHRRGHGFDSDWETKNSTYHGRPKTFFFFLIKKIQLDLEKGPD